MWRETINRNVVVVVMVAEKRNVVVVVYSSTIHEAVLKIKVESRVDVVSMYLWMEKKIYI